MSSLYLINTTRACLEFTNDGKSFIVGAGNAGFDERHGSARLFNLNNIKWEFELKGAIAIDEYGEEYTLYSYAHREPTSTVAISSNRKYIATGCEQGINTGDTSSVNLWNGITGDFIRTIMSFDEDVSCLKFSPNERFIAAGSYQWLEIYEICSGRSYEFSCLGTPQSIWFSEDSSVLLLADVISSNTVPNIYLVNFEKYPEVPVH